MPPIAAPHAESCPTATSSAALVAGLAMLALVTAGAGRAVAQQPAAALGGGPVGAAVGAIRGTVYDSLARRPLAGATVQAVSRDNPTAGRTTTSDSAGGFRFDSLPPSAYLVGFLDPLFDALDVSITPRLFEVAPGAPTLAPLAVPGLATMRSAICGPDAEATSAGRDSAGLLIGFVRKADGDGAAPGSSVVVTWNELVVDQKGLRTERRRVPVTVLPGGGYAACGVPADAPVTASAQAPGRESGLLEIALGPTRFLRRDFVLGDSAAASAAPNAQRAGTAELTGIVRGPNGRALRGAHVQVWGTERQAVTGEDGRFGLIGLPVGTRTVEVRAIGFAPLRSAVDLARGRAASLQLAFAKPAPTLDRVTVIGKPSLASRWQDEFLARRREGWGKFFTSVDVDRVHPRQTTDMLRQAAGVRLVPLRGQGYAVRLRDGCKPAVVLDGMSVVGGADDVDLLVNPQDLAGMEVYTGLAGIPVQYAGLQANGCGAVLLWTKR